MRPDLRINSRSKTSRSRFSLQQRVVAHISKQVTGTGVRLEGDCPMVSTSFGNKRSERPHRFFDEIIKVRVTGMLLRHRQNDLCRFGSRDVARSPNCHETDQWRIVVRGRREQIENVGQAILPIRAHADGGGSCLVRRRAQHAPQKVRVDHIVALEEPQGFQQMMRAVRGVPIAFEILDPAPGRCDHRFCIAARKFDSRALRERPDRRGPSSRSSSFSIGSPAICGGVSSGRPMYVTCR